MQEHLKIDTAANPKLVTGYTSDLEAFERVFGPRLESAKKQDMLTDILGIIGGYAYASLISRN